MKLSIDFSIFDSPSSAYGNVTGEMFFSGVPLVGQHVKLLDDLVLKVLNVTRIPEAEGMLVVGLDDVVVFSRREADVLAKRLEDQLDFFCVVYDAY